MENQKKEIGRFVFAIQLFEDQSGNLITKTLSSNTNVLPELVITPLRSLVKTLEDD